MRNEQARIALREFGINKARLTQLASRHNDVYRVAVPGGKRYVLRLQNDLLSDAQAAAQVVWLQALARDSGVRVPAPVPTADGRPFTHLSADGETRRAVLLRWLPGAVARKRGDAVYRSAAKMMAQMHRHARSFVRGRRLDCRTLDDAWLFGERFFVRSTKARAYVKTAERRIVAAAERKVRRAMETLGRSPRRFGLIHADLNLDNILFHRGRASPIDFDEFGRGWYLFDLAELIRTSISPENWAERKRFALDAYQRFEPLDGAEVEAFDAFIAATFVQYLNWAFHHARDEKDLQWVGFCIAVLARVVQHEA